MGELNLPAAFTWRRARLEDAEAAHALVVAHHGATGGVEPPPFAEITADLAYPDLDLDRDTWIVEDDASRPVLYAIAYCDRPGRTFFDIFVDPTLPHEMRFAVALAVARAALERVLEDARERELTETLAESGMLRDDRFLAEVLTTVGLAPARTWWRMSADKAAITAATPVVPDGFRVDLVDATDDEVLRVAHALEEETFKDHYGNVSVGFEVFRTEYRNSAGYDPTAWWIAYDAATDEPAALLIGNDSRAEGGAGFVDTLGVREQYRGRGVASAMLLTAFAEYATRGRTSVALSVDASNETGAVALYERVGMKPLDVIVSWERTLTL